MKEGMGTVSLKVQDLCMGSNESIQIRDDYNIVDILNTVKYSL